MYHDIVTCSQQKLNNFLFSICLVDNHISPYFLMLVWWHERKYEINYSHFFRGGWCGCLKWCNMWAHKRIISASTFDFLPTLAYQSTSADLRQQRLTSFCAVCGVLFYYKRESTVVSSGARGVTLVTHICSHSAECLYASFCNQTWYCGAPPWAGMSCEKKGDSIFKVKVTVWAYIIKIWLFLLWVLNQWVFCNQTQFDSRSSFISKEVFSENIGLLRSRSTSQPRLNVSINDS